MSGSLAYAFGLVSSALGAAVAGVPWVAVAALLTAVPYLAIGLLRAREALRSRQSRARLLLR
jgi:hypothetical protein